MPQPPTGDPADLGAAGILPPLREVIARHGLSARKGLGQNFLLDLNLTGRIARAAGDLGRGTTIEIGPGPGGLTRALLAHGACHVLALEIDPRCVAALDELRTAYPDRLTIVEADATDTDIAALCAARGLPAPLRIVANLPYNVATPLLIGWLARATDFESLTLMFQKEVAERLAATPGRKSYGRLSVAAQWRCTVRLLFSVPPSAFTPQPSVMSSVVSLVPRAVPLAPADPRILETVVAAAFNQRRKMLRTALRPVSSDVASLLARAGIDPTRRAETLSVEEFCTLARAAAD